MLYLLLVAVPLEGNRRLKISRPPSGLERRLRADDFRVEKHVVFLDQQHVSLDALGYRPQRLRQGCDVVITMRIAFSPV